MISVKRIRCDREISQAALAELLGVSQQAVAQWETGKAYPRGEILVKLADVLHCTIDELYGREPPQDSA